MQNEECKVQNEETNHGPAGFRFAFFILHYAFEVSVAGLAPARAGLKTRLLELLCIHGRKKWGAGVLECWSAGFPALHHSATPLPRVVLGSCFVSEQRTEGRDDRDEPGIHQILNHCLNVFVGGRRLFVEQVALPTDHAAA